LDFWAGVGVVAFAVGEGIGDGNGVAAAFAAELAFVAEAGPGLLARFELAALRAANEFDRSAAFLFASDEEAVR
jgi:hypothetical protein